MVRQRPTRLVQQEGTAEFDDAARIRHWRDYCDPGDTAAAVAYLASEGAAAMTGQVLCADGGLIMR